MTTEFSGSLRESLAVEHWISALDDSGGDAGAWVAAGPAWAALVPVAALAATDGEQRVARPRFRMTLRARGDVGLATRFRWRGRVLTVLRSEPDPRMPAKLTLLVEDRT